MATRINWSYLSAFALMSILASPPAQAQPLCVESHTSAGVALADLDGHLSRIGAHLSTLDTLFSNPSNLLSLLAAQSTNAQLAAETNSLTVKLPVLIDSLSLPIPNIPIVTGAVEDVTAATTVLVQSILAVITNLRSGLPGLPGLPVSHPTRVGINDALTDVHAARASLPPLCD